MTYEAGIDNVKHIEVAGYISRPPTKITPKLSTFGGSFFEWNQGNPERIARTLQMLGAKRIKVLKTTGERAVD